MKSKLICKTFSDGSKYWYLNGIIHRENGPSIEHANGDKFWWLNGELHREDSPAVEYANGSKTWWLNGHQYTKPDFYRELYKRGKITREELFIHLL